MTQETKHRRTSAIQAGVGTDKAYKAVMPPLYLSSTFEIDGIGHKPLYDYSRTHNPTRDELASAITELENGVGACITSSGMAALTLIVHLLGPDDLLIAPFDCYGRSYRLLCALSEKKHFKLKFIDQYNPKTVEEAFAEESPKMVLIETPSNPVLRIADIQAIVGHAKQAGALTVVDNTFLSPDVATAVKIRRGYRVSFDNKIPERT